MFDFARIHGFSVTGEPDGTDQYALLPAQAAPGALDGVERIDLVPGATETSAPG